MASQISSARQIRTTHTQTAGIYQKLYEGLFIGFPLCAWGFKTMALPSMTAFLPHNSPVKKGTESWESQMVSFGGPPHPNAVSYLPFWPHLLPFLTWPFHASKPWHDLFLNRFCPTIYLQGYHWSFTAQWPIPEPVLSYDLSTGLLQIRHSAVWQKPYWGDFSKVPCQERHQFTRRDQMALFQVCSLPCVSNSPGTSADHIICLSN